jgi:hypothetical protein
VLAKLDEVTVMQRSFDGLTVIDEQGVLATQVTESWSPILSPEFSMKRGDHRISGLVEHHTTIFPRPKPEILDIEVLGLPAKATSKMMQHELHDWINP